MMKSDWSFLIGKILENKLSGGYYSRFLDLSFRIPHRMQVGFSGCFPVAVQAKLKERVSFPEDNGFMPCLERKLFSWEQSITDATLCRFVLKCFIM